MADGDGLWNFRVRARVGYCKGEWLDVDLVDGLLGADVRLT